MEGRRTRILCSHSNHGFFICTIPINQFIFKMKSIITLLFALFLILSCGSTREDDPIPTPAPITISTELQGTYKVLTKKNVGGGYIANTDNTLFVTVTANSIRYKTGNGGLFEGTGLIEKGSNADNITLSNGTKLTMFKTIQSDGSQNFYFVHSNFMVDDYMVKKN